MELRSSASAAPNLMFVTVGKLGPKDNDKEDKEKKDPVFVCIVGQPLTAVLPLANFDRIYAYTEVVNPRNGIVVDKNIELLGSVQLKTIDANGYAHVDNFEKVDASRRSFRLLPHHLERGDAEVVITFLRSTARTTATTRNYFIKVGVTRSNAEKVYEFAAKFLTFNDGESHPLFFVTPNIPITAVPSKLKRSDYLALMEPSVRAKKTSASASASASAITSRPAPAGASSSEDGSLEEGNLPERAQSDDDRTPVAGPSRPAPDARAPRPAPRAGPGPSRPRQPTRDETIAAIRRLEADLDRMLEEIRQVKADKAKLQEEVVGLQAGVAANSASIVEVDRRREEDTQKLQTQIDATNLELADLRQTLREFDERVMGRLDADEASRRADHAQIMGAFARLEGNAAPQRDLLGAGFRRNSPASSKHNNDS